MDSPRTLAALFGAATLALAAAPSASADFAWLTPATDVSSNTASNFSTPRVGVGPNGDVTVVFDRGIDVFSASRPPGGTFGSPQTITSTAVASATTSVAVDALGNAYAVWTEPFGMGGSAVKASVRPQGGVWGMPDTLDSTGSPDEPAVAVTPSGDAVAVWRRQTGTAVLRMARRPAGGSWGGNFSLFDGGSGAVAAQPSLDLNAAGDAAVAFRRRIGGGVFFTEAVFQPATSSVPATSIFNPGAGAGDDDDFPTVGVDNAGNAAVMLGRGGTIKVSNKPAGSGTWSSIAGTNGNVDAPADNSRMVWNDSGQQAAVWRRNAGATLQASTRSDLGAWAPPTPIGPAAMGVSYFGDEVAISPAGVAIAVFIGNTTLHSARTSGASWNAVNDIASTGNPVSPKVAADAQGNAAVAFQAKNASNTDSILAAGFDGAGPRLDDIVFPANPAPGQVFSYSVTPIDVWSGVASTGWTFGEGSSATGASGTFAYPAAGNFTATVTSTDSRGNQSSAIRNATVGGGGGGGSGGGSDTTAPAFQSARLTNTTFRVNRRGPAEQPSSSAKRGTTFVYSLSEAARVVFTIQRALPGRRVGGRCRKPTRRNRTRPRCTRFVRFGSFAKDSAAGRNRKRFSGKIGRRSLRPGRYRAVLRARDAAGNRSSARRLKFRVVRR